MNNISVNATLGISAEKAWEIWTTPAHIKNWNHASGDWHTPHAHVDLKPGGKFIWRMEAKDGSFGFDFEGTFDEIEPFHHLSYTLADSRKVDVRFVEEGGVCTITETFEPENENPLDLQKTGWQAILDNYKRYCESINN